MFRIDFYKESDKSLNYHMSILDEKCVCIHYELIKYENGLSFLEEEIKKILKLKEIKFKEIKFKGNLISIYIEKKKDECFNKSK